MFLYAFNNNTLGRIRRKFLPQIPVCQYGFMRDRSTRNVIFVIRVLCERCVEHQQNVFLCFVDYKKSIEKVRDLKEIEEGLTVNGVNGKFIYNIRYADDTMLLASSETGLQSLVNAVQISGEKLTSA